MESNASAGEGAKCLYPSTTALQPSTRTLSAGYLCDGISMNTEREDAVVKHSSHEICERALRDSLHEALETGPLKSEAQGLDLSVDIAGNASYDTPHR